VLLTPDLLVPAAHRNLLLVKPLRGYSAAKAGLLNTLNRIKQIANASVDYFHSQFIHLCFKVL
jgi:hypothetical protein